MSEIPKVATIFRQRLSLVALSVVIVLLSEVVFGAEQKAIIAVSQVGETITVDATMKVQVPITTAWDVMTDFDHMTSILGNLTSSKVISRNGDIFIIRQKGSARYGFLSFPFESEREIRLEPMKRILARNLSGTLKRMDSDVYISSVDQIALINYHAEIVPDSFLARIFGASFVRHEVEEQLQRMADEMLRRYALNIPSGN